MKTVINGNGQDVTAAVNSWLASRNQLFLADLYLIGYPEDPQALWLTNWQAPLNWAAWGTFQSAVIKRGSVTTKIGLDPQKLDVTWTPANSPYVANMQLANAYQRVQAGYYDNMPVRVWSVYMPAAGDANTFGASQLFGGRVGATTCQRGTITFSVSSFLDVVTQNVPTNLIEILNTGAAYAGATPPAGWSTVPQFNVIGPASPNVLILDNTSGGGGAHHIYGANVLQHGFVMFNYGPNATLGGQYSAIAQNVSVTVGLTNYNQIVLFTPLIFPPTPGVDTCFISGPAPINSTDGDYGGFPFVPSPLSSV